MTLRDALAAITPHLHDEVCVAANGFISRAVSAVRDREDTFYMIGSMGLAAAIGFGIALAQPKRRVLVFDGDGNVLMGMGELASIAAAKPANLWHLCFDNGVHASTGGQRTIADRVVLSELARAAGYRWVKRSQSAAELGRDVPEFLATVGPAFLHVCIAPGPPGPPEPRITHTPPELTARLRHALGTPR